MDAGVFRFELASMCEVGKRALEIFFFVGNVRELDQRLCGVRPCLSRSLECCPSLLQLTLRFVAYTQMPISGWTSQLPFREVFEQVCEHVGLERRFDSVENRKDICFSQICAARQLLRSLISASGVF